MIAYEQRRLGQCQMNTDILHRAQRFDDARQLAFQRTLLVDLFAELADAKLFQIQ